jgi:MoaA/NifB/PqqE/SkfB family radical SAM enzyme
MNEKIKEISDRIVLEHIQSNGENGDVLELFAKALFDEVFVIVDRNDSASDARWDLIEHFELGDEF